MSNSKRTNLVSEVNVNTKDFLDIFKESLGENYEDFIMYKVLEIFEETKDNVSSLLSSRQIKNLEFEMNNYGTANNTLELLLGSETIIWTKDSFEDDIKENLIKLDILGVTKINLKMFYQIIEFLLLEKILLFEEVQFESILKNKKDLYYKVLRVGIENSKEDIEKLRKKIKKINVKITRKIEELSILDKGEILQNMKIILESRYKGLDYKQFICTLYPELYFEEIENIRKIVEKVEEEEIYENEVALFKINSKVKTFLDKIKNI